MKTLKAQYIADVQSLSDEALRTALADLEPHAIDNVNWNEFPYAPSVTFRIAYSEKAIALMFEVNEAHVKATALENNGPVWEDSCVEFFFQPDNADGRYLSFEINPLGTLLIGLGHGIPDIVYLPDDRSQFNIETYREDHYWQVCYQIPESFMKQFFKELSPQIRGNFMKCADDSAKPHHGCWSNIIMPHPAYHVPQFFGHIVLEQE